MANQKATPNRSGSRSAACDTAKKDYEDRRGPEARKARFRAREEELAELMLDDPQAEAKRRLEVLNERLGYGVGARKERARLQGIADGLWAGPAKKSGKRKQVKASVTTAIEAEPRDLADREREVLGEPASVSVKPTARPTRIPAASPLPVRSRGRRAVRRRDERDGDDAAEYGGPSVGVDTLQTLKEALEGLDHLQG